MDYEVELKQLDIIYKDLKKSLNKIKSKENQAYKELYQVHVEEIKELGSLVLSTTTDVNEPEKAFYFFMVKAFRYREKLNCIYKFNRKKLSKEKFALYKLKVFSCLKELLITDSYATMKLKRYNLNFLVFKCHSTLLESEYGPICKEMFKHLKTPFGYNFKLNFIRRNFKKGKKYFDYWLNHKIKNHGLETGYILEEDTNRKKKILRLEHSNIKK